MVSIKSARQIGFDSVGVNLKNYPHAFVWSLANLRFEAAQIGGGYLIIELKFVHFLRLKSSKAHECLKIRRCSPTVNGMADLRQHFWWFPLARRTLRWSLTMAYQWGRWPFLLGGQIGAFAYLEGPSDDSFGAAIGYWAFLFPFGLTCLFGLGGLLTGALSSFYAPPTEPKNPFQSAFFKSVARQTFRFWLLSGLVATPGFFYVTNWAEDFRTFHVYLLLLSILWSLSAWSALSQNIKTR